MILSIMPFILKVLSLVEDQALLIRSQAMLMATLTETAYHARRIIKYGTILLILLIILRITWAVGYRVYRIIVPPKPPPPTVAFGRLPTLPFPEKERGKFSFSLQTPTGELPEFPPSVNVYFMPQAAASFLDLDNATLITRRLGFTGESKALSETIYRFEHPSAPASIDMNIVNKTFSLNYNLSASPELLNVRPQSTQRALQAVHSFLSGAGLLPPDLASGEPKFEFIKVSPPNLVPAISLSEANFIRVNLFRQDYDGLPVLTPDRNKSNVWFFVSGSNSRGKQIIAGEYHYFPVDLERSATYPIKTAQQAWDELLEGGGYIASAPTSGESQITIRRVYLAYYDSGQAQEFLQPIVVFEGDDNFSAYVPAVTAEYYGSQE